MPEPHYGGWMQTSPPTPQSAPPSAGLPVHCSVFPSPSSALGSPLLTSCCFRAGEVGGRRAQVDGEQGGHAGHWQPVSLTAAQPGSCHPDSHMPSGTSLSSGHISTGGRGWGNKPLSAARHPSRTRGSLCSSCALVTAGKEFGQWPLEEETRLPILLPVGPDCSRDPPRPGSCQG